MVGSTEVYGGTDFTKILSHFNKDEVSPKNKVTDGKKMFRMPGELQSAAAA